MELIEALRTTGAVRDFTDRAVEDAVLARVLDTARFAPSGANAQAGRVVVIKDAENRRRLRACYMRGSRDYLALAAAGLRPWAPTSDREPDIMALAAVIALGYPVRAPRGPRRQPVSSFATVDQIGGPPFGV
jgi:nitroreductase